jgi:hypothetical protein
MKQTKYELFYSPLNNKKIYPHNYFKFFCLLLLSTTICNDTHCINFKDQAWSFFSYSSQPSPLRQPNNPELSEKRRLTDKDKNELDVLLSVFPNTIIVRKIAPGERPGTCFNVAMKEILELTNDQFQQIEKLIVGSDDWISIINILQYFSIQQNSPQKGDLAVYSSDNSIKHFGIVTNSGTIKSKPGSIPYIIEHEYWEIYSVYGDMIYFHQLKECYRDQKGKKLLFTNIMNTVQNSEQLKQNLHDAQELLFTLAENRNLTFKDFSPNIFIQRNIGLNINFPDEDGNTSLALASKEGNRELVALLLQYNAHTGLKNKDGKTAFDLAQENEDDTIRYMLKSHETYYFPIDFCLFNYF